MNIYYIQFTKISPYNHHVGYYHCEGGNSITSNFYMDFKQLNCKVFFIVVVVIVSIFFCYLFVSSKYSDCYVGWLELRRSPTEIRSEGWSGRNMNC